MEINASELTHKELNDAIRECMLAGAKKIVLRNVYGQRYIGTRLCSCSKNPGGKTEIEIFGTPGNDLGAFLDGYRIIVHGNAQDGVGNTMDDGEITIDGRAGDIVAMSMRGGEIFIRDNVGYRAAIHMKEYHDKKPVLVIGGTAQDFLGEYMAGGIVILLGLNLKDASHKANFIGTGMHGGVIYIRGKVEKHQLGKEVGLFELNEEDREELENRLREYSKKFQVPLKMEMAKEFVKLIPYSHRPYGQLYAY
jgi:glutamate synthase domain-containing protein 3